MDDLPDPGADEPVLLSSSRTRISVHAMWSVISGVVGLATCFLVVTPVAAIVLGVKGLLDIRAHPGRVEGRSFALGGIALGLVGLWLGGTIIFSAIGTSDDSADGESAVATPADDFGVGTCTGSPEGLMLVDLREVDCALTHGGEVVERAPIGEDTDSYPGDDEARSRADERCAAGFEDYVGSPAADSPLRLHAFPPDRDRWDAGQRDVICIAANPEGDLAAGSLVGTGG